MDYLSKAKVLKVDESLGLVFGWASVITENDKSVVDSQGDVIKADVLLEATTNFMLDVRTAKAMHDGEGIGEVVHSFPLTTDISKALGIDLKGREGWIVGVKIHDAQVLKDAKAGKLPSFSIGGKGVREEYENG